MNILPVKRHLWACSVVVVVTFCEHGVRGTRDFWLESALIVRCSSSSCISCTRDENLAISALYLADSMYPGCV